MIEPHSAQLGESALTLKATFVLAPSDAVMAATAVPAACPFPLPFPFEYATAGSGAAAGESAATDIEDTSFPEGSDAATSDVEAGA